MQKVSIVKGRDRKENITRAICLIEDEIEKSIKNKESKRLFIKINAVDSNFPLACTHIEALDAVLSVFYNKFNEIIVGDNSFVFTKDKGRPYRDILNKFPKIKLSDLTEFETKEIEFKKLDGTKRVGKYSLLPEKSFTISLALPKTHDTFVYTGCLKNMHGCVIKNREGLHALKLHERMILNRYVKSNKLKWDNLVNMIGKIKPDLCILDGYEGMEKEGPIFGSKIELGIAMCSLDGVALDKLASRICGLGFVPYLSMFPDKENSGNYVTFSPEFSNVQFSKTSNTNNRIVHNDIEIIKEGFQELEEISKKFKHHYKNKYQTITSINLPIPLIDVRFILSVLRRSYRLKDKIIEKIRDKVI